MDAIQSPQDDGFLTLPGPVSPASRAGSGVGTSRSAPRLNMGVATKQILSGIGHGVTRTGREGRRRERGEGPPSRENVTGSQQPPEHNHVSVSGTHVHMYNMCTY